MSSCARSIVTFHICLYEMCVRVGGRAGVRYVITTFSGKDSLPNFLTHGAPLRALRAREELRYNLRKPSIQPRLQGQTQVDTEKPLKKAEIRCENQEIGNTGSAEIRIIRKSANLKSIRNRSQVRKKKQRSVHPCFRASSWRLNQSRSKVAPKPKFPACLGGKNG